MKILKSSKELIKYETPKAELTYFNIIAANGNELIHIRCYQTPKYTMVKPGRSFRFIDLVKKEDTFWLVSSSKMAFSPPVNVPEGQFDGVLLPEDLPKSGSKRTITKALGSPEKSSVSGKIVKVSPIAFKMDGTLPVRCLAVKDKTAIAKVALFDKLATNTYEEGAAIELTAVYQKTFNTRPQLTASRETTCQFITSQELSNLPVTDADRETLEDDPDFKVWPLESDALDLEIDCIYDAFSYQCCPQLRCRQKKLIQGKCPTCSGVSTKWTYRANVNIKNLIVHK